MCYTFSMANATDSSSIQYKTIDTPTVEIQQEDNSGGNLLVPQEQNQLQEQILVSPTPIPTLPPKPIQYNFFNVRVLGVIIGIVFLWMYIRGLKKR